MHKKAAGLWAGMVMGIGCAAAVPAGADEAGDAARIEALVARVAQLEAQRDQAVTAPAEASRLTINGFLSAGFSRVDADWQYDGGRLDEDWSHTAESIAGLQLGVRVTDRVSAVTQLVGRGEDDFAVGAEWAYVGWQPDEANEWRAGRQRIPLFMLSEYLDVGYAHPGVKPPIEAYNPDLPSAYDGLSWTYRLNRGAWSHEWMLYAGATETGIAGGSFAIDDMVGGAWFASTGPWTLRAGYAEAQTTFSNPMLAGFEPILGAIDREEGSFGGVGLQYDGDRVLVLAEYELMRVGSWFPDYAQGYVTVGLHAGKWMPHLTVADVENTDKDERYVAALPMMCPPVCMDPPANTMAFPADTFNTMLDGDQRSVTLGLRYDFLANAAAKVDWTHVTDTDGTWGKFVPADGNWFGPKPDRHVDVFRLAVDVVF